VSVWSALVFVVLSGLAVMAGCGERYEEGQVLSVRVEPGPGESLTAGIVIEDVRVIVGTLAKDVSTPETPKEYHAGDLCLVISGRMRNATNEGLMVGYSVTGYDSQGDAVAWTLTSHHIPGAASLGVPPQSTEDFEIVVSWSSEVSVLEMTGGASGDQWPYAPSTPSSPLPESEITSVILSLQWVLENDTEPNPGTVRITFPATWLENPPPIQAGEEAVELSVPTRLLMDSNTSKNPDELTVTLPNRYFKGL